MRHRRYGEQQPQQQAEYLDHLRTPNSGRSGRNPAPKRRSNRDVRHKSLIHKPQILFDEI
jgi:hypothetical protein